MSSLRFSWLAFVFCLAVTSFAENKLPRGAEVVEAVAQVGDDTAQVSERSSQGAGGVRGCDMCPVDYIV